jgi:hypothetical protein
MSRSRRLYFYGVALFGLIVSLVSLIMFLWREGAQRAAAFVNGGLPYEWLLSSAWPWLALFVIALATWLFHIVMANREARPLTMTGAVERAAPERKMYLYGGRLVVIAILAAQLWLLIRASVTAFLDGGTGGLREAIGWPLGLALGALAAFGYWFYLHHEARADGDLGQERGGAVLWRRLYTYGAALAGAVLAFAGAGELIRAAIRVLMAPLSGDISWHISAAGALAALVVGLPLASLAWRAANRAASYNPPAETNALSRVLLRYDGVLLATLITLLTFGYLIEQVILRAIGRPDGVAGRPLLGAFDWTWALAYLPVAAVTWISFASGARMDAAWGGEKPRTAAIRRVARYLVTAAALFAFWYGLTEFTRLILQVFLGADTSAATASQWVQRFATSAAFLLVGAPAWWGHWWSQQIRARGDDASAYAERASKVRRVYLVGVILVGTVVVVAAAGFALFLVTNWQSASSAAATRAAVAGAAAAALVALFWGLAHAGVLRGDMRWLAQQKLPPAETPVLPVQSPAPIGSGLVPAVAVAGAAVGSPIAARREAGAPPGVAVTATRQFSRQELAPLAADAGVPMEVEQDAYAELPLRPPYALAVMDSDDGALGAALASALRAAYPDAVIWPVGLTSEAEGAMLNALGESAEPAPPDALDQVAAVLAPSDLLFSAAFTGEGGWLAGVAGGQPGAADSAAPAQPAAALGRGAELASGTVDRERRHRGRERVGRRDRKVNDGSQTTRQALPKRLARDDIVLHKLSQTREAVIHLFLRVVVREPCANDAAGLLQPQPLRDSNCVKVAGPDVNAALRQVRPHLVRMAAGEPERRGRRAAVKLLRVADAVEGKAGDCQQALDEVGEQRTLVCLDCGHCLLQGEPPAGEPRKLPRVGRAACLAELRKVLHGGEHARLRLVVLRTGFELVGRGVARRAHLVRS